MKKRIIILLMPLITYSFSGVFNVAKALDRPEGCVTSVSAYPIANVDHNRCATFSPGGFTLNLFDGDETTVGGQASYNFVATTDFGGGVGDDKDIGTYVYRKNDDTKFFITVGSNFVNPGGQIYKNYYWRTAQDKVWNYFTSGDRDYQAVPKDFQLPKYKEAFQGDPRKKFVWNMVTTGQAKINGESMPSGSTLEGRMLLQDRDGPLLARVNGNDEGKIEWSLAGGSDRGGVYVSENGITMISIYARVTTPGGSKYEKYIDLKYPDDFKPHGTRPEEAVMPKVGTLLFDFGAGDDVTDKGFSQDVNSVIGVIDKNKPGCSIDFGLSYFNVPICYVMTGIWNEFIKPFSKLTLDILTGIVY